MGILRDVIKSAIAPDTSSNGLGGPNLPFMGGTRGLRNGLESRQYSSRSPYSSTSYDRDDSTYREPPPALPPRNPRYSRYSDDASDFDNVANGFQPDGYGSDRRGEKQRSWDYDSPPAYTSNRLARRSSYPDNSSYPSPNGSRSIPYGAGYSEPRDSYYDYSPSQRSARPVAGGWDFRPLVLPQIAFGDGAPFLRGYSDELAPFGIREREFFEVIDAINIAIVPSPENQIFQKGANIAGWFVPGAAGIGLMVGQVGAGLGAAYGKASSVARVLSQMNMELFLPKGLEICLCGSQDVDAEVGFSPRANMGDMVAPEQRVYVYGDYVASVTRSTPPVSTGGRNDPIAMLGRGLADRSSSKTLRKAQKDAAKGKFKKSDSLQSDLKWIMVRRASPQALAFLDQGRP